EETERPAIYLTNALTGWETPEGQHGYLPFPEFQDEMDRAGEVKRDKPILVVLGNPPYNAYAGVAVTEERDLTTAYRAVKRVRSPEGQGLNDLYVRFFRMAERRIVERTGRGVVCLISNYSWLDGLSFTGMRERYLDAFDGVWIDCLNGDKYKTGKLTPQGEPDPSIFSTEHNREGIQVGTSIALLVRKESSSGTRTIQFRHLWGKTKRQELLATANQEGKSLYQRLSPPIELGLPFMPALVAKDYFDWPLLPDLIPISFPGVKTSRDEFLVDIDRERLERRIRKYFDPETAHEDMRGIAPTALKSTTRFDAEKVRNYLRKRGFLSEKIVRYYYRPFDFRWLYWEPETELLDRKRADYLPLVSEENLWLSAGQRNRKEVFYQPQVTSRLADHHIVESNVAMFPLYERSHALEGPASAGDRAGQIANLTRAAKDYVGQLESTERDLFFHVIATLHAPTYRDDNLGALRQDWPRVPLPPAKELLLQSTGLGERIAALLDPETPVTGVTAGTIRAEMRTIGPIQRTGGGPLKEKDLRLTARWGYAGQNRVTMPGPGDARRREYDDDERTAISEGASALELTADEALECLGEATYDVYLNDLAYWRNVPERVWRYTIGGYQVIKKWLSYREYALLSRPMSADEAREVTNMARRIAAILLMGPALDANYQAVCDNTWPWPGRKSVAD
ncbi:MAG: DNA methyltransferase, partial [Proteobacteria bacterium]|nr:DNA methyltransferase [Pseudomonadota bacterium]